MRPRMTRLTTDSKTNIELVKKIALEQYPDNQNLAMLTAAQAILESRLNGVPSQLALEDNNLFGIKGSGTDGSQEFWTHEEVDGKMIEVRQNFAVNKSVEDSFAQHRRVLGLPRYENLTQKGLSFQSLAYRIRQDGYATDSSYTQELIDVYNKYLKE